MKCLKKNMIDTNDLLTASAAKDIAMSSILGMYYARIKDVFSKIKTEAEKGNLCASVNYVENEKEYGDRLVYLLKELGYRIEVKSYRIANEMNYTIMIFF